MVVKYKVSRQNSTNRDTPKINQEKLTEKDVQILNKYHHVGPS